jgi:hypothetical protein
MFYGCSRKKPFWQITYDHITSSLSKAMLHYGKGSKAKKGVENVDNWVNLGEG